ncbi:chemotaxis response regulator protein-glutamate methylesterase [Vitiosangium sp. GDMCC 1.1324]|uniref:protein-glutamate methylesterase/protein-glutamine glutaminase n=1 Tax=Vitiosangium sp. (strain GDMCC 1.1324) TaxID=2138576 RepID=UPI000D337E61|nr:chemotaxis response regulator protein-glutamate methylesterase [Vitiosangium sp. GDMCC 1.1324]PTL76433.1 chemotaxis response regulator protein-glutamate methylesterase [Vitiosangium sp. GDMCC 1.1324]
MTLPAEERPLHVLVVDDSAVVREALTAVLRSGGMSVATAADPLIAQEKIKRERPDVIVLDLEMPRMDGLSFLRKLRAEDPIPVVICSGLTGHYAEAAILALEEGASEVVTKPKLGVRDFLHESAIRIIDAVRAAAGTRWRTARPRPVAKPLGPVPRPALRITSDKVVALGASTGGTEALRFLLEAMPPDAPGMVIVQHMPEGFTAAFAKRLHGLCRIEVKEAANGDRVNEGRALIAPGNRHLVLVRSGAHYAVEVMDGPLVSRHRPSVDVLFRSVSQAAGPNALGVLMTGMGDDGADGLLAMKQSGAMTFAQDEASCVVFGMPRAAIVRGAVHQVLPLTRIPQAILTSAREA